MKRIKWSSLSVQVKITLVYILTNLLILLVNLVLLIGINRMSTSLEQVYRDNVRLNEISTQLDSVQNSMTQYLTSKTSDSLGEYYVNAQNYANYLSDLSDEITNNSFERMYRNIKYMSANYLDSVAQTIDAKRGRNVEKYRLRYEEATRLYEYINEYITSLNNLQFVQNSENYVELLNSYNYFEKLSIGIIVLMLLGNTFIIIKLTGDIIEPLRHLAIYADDVSKGNFDIQFIETKSEDEIGVVTNAFNKMIVSIRDYIEKVRVSLETERQLKEKELRMETHLKDAQLKYLQAQINPHFMFNTLNAGAQLSMLEGADRTYEYLQNVAEFFRYNVKKGNETVTIKEEIELVNHYIYILNVRFSGDIHYDEEIDESLLNTAMPSMILQPIVENSVNHGIREMGENGRISLSVYKMDNLACISICDNGKGMSRENIEKVLNGTYRDMNLTGDSNGVGMDNVIARLKLFTESEDVMSIISEGKNMGTEVIIYLPMETGDV